MEDINANNTGSESKNNIKNTSVLNHLIPNSDYISSVN